MAAPDYTEYSWDHLERGSVLVVTLSGPAYLRLMDPENFAAFQDSDDYDFRGGLARKAPYRIKVPRSGPWYLAVDLSGLGVRGVRHAVSVEPPQRLGGPLTGKFE